MLLSITFMISNDSQRPSILLTHSQSYQPVIRTGIPDNQIITNLDYRYWKTECEDINEIYFISQTVPQFNNSIFYNPVMLGL